MKKTVAIFTLLVCLFVISAIPAYANNSARVNTQGNMNGIGDEMRQDVNRTMNNADRTLRNNNAATPDGNMGNNGNNFRNNNANNGNNFGANNYRTNAAGDNDGMDWGWIGLLGLIGLAGLRNRDRDRA